MTDENDVSYLRTKMKYGLYGLAIISLLLVGGYIVPATWLVALKVLFGIV